MSDEPVFSGLMPHPPIIVPEVGRERLAACRSTVDACREFARRLMASRPDRLLLVSPHSPRRRHAFGLWGGHRHRGDLGRFGAATSSIDLVNDSTALATLSQTAQAHQLETWALTNQPLDHGAVVPLWFLAEAGWDGPTTLVSLPLQPTPALMTAFGQAVAEAYATLGDDVALIASGDMSHRVLPDAPAGYHPRAIEFDRTLTNLITRGQLDQISSIDPELRELAAEDAADTSILVAAAVGAKARGTEVLSYEHPFGVGYLVAILHNTLTLC